MLYQEEPAGLLGELLALYPLSLLCVPFPGLVSLPLLCVPFPGRVSLPLLCVPFPCCVSPFLAVCLLHLWCVIFPNFIFDILS